MNNTSDIGKYYNIQKIGNENISYNYPFQMFMRDCVKVPERKMYALGIQNEKKLPEFFRLYVTEEFQFQFQKMSQNQKKQQFNCEKQGIDRAKFKYVVQAPSFFEITKNISFNNGLQQFKQDQMKVPNDVDEILVVENEINLIFMLILIIIKIDPDLIGGFDVETKSLFYIQERAKQYDIDFIGLIGRSPSDLGQVQDLFLMENQYFEGSNQSSIFSDKNRSNSLISSKNANKSKIYQNQQNSRSLIQDEDKNKNGQIQANILNKNKILKKSIVSFYPGSNISGRIVLSLYRKCRQNISKLENYDFENIIKAIYKVQIAKFSDYTLSEWYGDYMMQRQLVFKYFFEKLQWEEKIMEHIDIVNTYTEMSRLYGCDIQTMIKRGEIFRIETVFCKVSKKLDYLLLSASRQQVTNQKLLSGQPLVFEPPKLLYVDPVIVLDFQSLYPSIVIAYNLCYSTCLGMISENFKNGEKLFGVKNDTQINLKNLFNGMSEYQIKDSIFIAPSGIAFVKKHIRTGVINQILKEFLDTRIMIKQSMKYYKNNKSILNKLNIRQKAIKLFMVSLYGYTGAIYTEKASMPSTDLTDSITKIASDILKQVIDHINAHKQWNAKVDYGDTDSVFVLLKGRSRQEAFQIGKQITEEINKMFPHPIELKLEKVYQPLIMVAKKRYVGYKYESADDKPVLEGKGIEIVRRDGCKAISKIMKKCIDMLFNNMNVSDVKQYLEKKWGKINNQIYNTQNYIIQKEVKLGSYTSVPAHAVVAEKQMKKDNKNIVKYGQRVKYVVLQGQENDNIKDLAMGIDEYIEDMKFQINSDNRKHTVKTINYFIE
ncbi:Ribonuclease H-like domain [Pseudocohnilembus persalinus]|uniref:DNA polymerase n=1 Tax=Pseudocohnilembus persalinus TaxID=266149 RepID=A0A0V0QSU5_PSEPJ|nr:Ribonuclease H-like domain [Pseudocohnilembus persalinus]|eukprot:KRX05340.1 Ribonuclease H-like domain [Pseudocohnilembus persalinus]